MQNHSVRTINYALSIIMVIFVVLGAYTGHVIFSPPYYKDGNTPPHIANQSKPRIMLVCVTEILGGAETHTYALYTRLVDSGYHTIILAADGSKFDRYLTEKNIPHYTTRAYDFRVGPLRPLYHLALRHSMRSICKQEKIDIITCNCTPEVPDALAMKKELPIKVVFTRHCVKYPRNEHIYNVDVLAAVNPSVAAYLKKKNEVAHLHIGQVLQIPPLFDATSLANYQSTQTREDFFKTNFNITLSPAPIITMVANFYKNLLHKNHPLLLEAVRILVYEKNKPVQVMLAGDGVRRAYLENLAQDLGIAPYVHFLGFTKNIAGVLYHSDALVHTSTFEAFGIIYLEAGYMHKPAIGAYQTAAEHIVCHQETGLLFKNGDAQDLAIQIERLVDDAQLATTLGKNAYNHVLKYFSPEVTFGQYEKIYQGLYQAK